ncbi:MAG: WD40 repeat domain-containing protein [Chitinispirillaceae bacterium]|nr:WD40 repeat domain-containing protein [Chitinispirillaceae bacterium]
MQYARSGIYRNALYRVLFSPVLMLSLFAMPTKAKIREIGSKLSIRPVIIRNLAYRADGTLFAIPNFVSAGSVALFEVNQRGEITEVPSRLSEKDFVRSAGLFHLRKENVNDPYMAFIGLPENLSGYAVDFSDTGSMLVIAGGNQAVIYDGGAAQWDKARSLTVGASVTRAVFSPDGKRLAVIADGKLYLFSTETYAAVARIEPATDCKFCDVTFSRDNTRCAVYEFRTVMFDYGARVRIFSASNGTHDRDLPKLSVRPSVEPQENFPLLSFAPGDSLLAVTIPTAFTGKVLLIESNDGDLYREYKGYCHSFSPDGTKFIAQGTVFSTADWSVLGKVPRATRTCVFSPTEPVVICITQDAVRRFRIEE